MSWEYLDIFNPSGVINVNGITYTNSSLKESTEPFIELRMYKPIRGEAIEEEIKYIYHKDNTLQVIENYKVFPREMIDGTPLLNVYGQMTFNNFLKNKESNGENT